MYILKDFDEKKSDCTLPAKLFFMVHIRFDDSHQRDELWLIMF